MIKSSTVIAVLSMTVLCLALSFEALAQQPEVGEEYAVLTIYNDIYSIAYPDDTIENGKLGYVSAKKLPEYTRSKKDLLNDFAEKGFKLVSTVNTGTNASLIDYIFVRPKKK